MATVAGPSTSNLALNTNAPEYFRCDTHCEGVLKRLRGREDLYDVVLVVGDSFKRISAHRLILIACSDYFSALLSGPMRESQEREITLLDVDGDALEQLVNFCYTGSLELRVGTIKNLITTANYLELKEITEGCCEFLQRNLQSSNCLSIASFAEQLNLDALLVNAKKFICENFEIVSKHPEFFLLTAKHLSEFIAKDDLDVPSEEFIFKVVMKWIEYEPENRRKHFTELLAQVRLPVLPSTFLAREVEPLCNTVESQKLVLSALKSHILLTSNSTQLRKYQSKSVVNHLLVIYEENQNFAIADYNLHTEVWTKWNTPIKFRRQFAAVLMDDDLMMVGGSLNELEVKTVTSLNVRTMAATKMDSLTASRYRLKVAILNRSIYAIGGYWCGTLDSVEKWDSNRKWHCIASMKDARRCSGVAVINEYLYVSGGESSNEKVLTSVECYDPVENTWRSKAPMQFGRVSHCLAAHNGYLFAIGGYNQKSYNIPIERYDPSRNIWSTIECSYEFVGSTRCASLGPDLFIMNNSIIYMTSNDSCSNTLSLKQLPKCTVSSMNSTFAELVALRSSTSSGKFD